LVVVRRLLLVAPSPPTLTCETRLPLLLQDNERKQRAQPKETPEEVAEAEAVFADF
jgi:hypothetical protein